MLSLRSFAFVLLVLTAAAGPVSAQSLSDRPLTAKEAAAVDHAVQSAMKEQHLVGVTVGVLRHGKTVYLQGYGWANQEARTPMTTETVLNWASNSKPLAAVLAMQLAEKGQLDLDTDVRKCVPEFPDKGVKITIRHLLCHQSGIPHYTNGKIIPTKKQYATPDPFRDPVLALDKFDKSPLLFHPGEKVAYSSYAYVLLSAAIQRAGQQSFGEQLQARIAHPLGLKTLQLDLEAREPNWSEAYAKQGEQVVRINKPEAHYWKQGAGGFKSNVGDFARWTEALINRELVSEQSEAAMWTPQSAGGKLTEWGLGFNVEQKPRLKVSHNGKQTEITTRMVIYPREKHGVVVMCNCGFADVGKISTAIYTALDSHREK